MSNIKSSFVSRSYRQFFTLKPSRLPRGSIAYFPTGFTRSFLIGTVTVWIFLFFCFGESYAQPAGLISRWTGDANADDTVGGNNGTLVNGATYTTGVLGQAFAFDGVDDYLQAPTVGLPTGSSNRTMTMWVRIDAPPPPGWESFFGGYGTFGGYQNAYSLGATGSLNSLFFSQWGGGVGGPNLQNGRWYHVAVTNNGNQATLYLDGLAVNTGVLTIATSTDSQFYMGKIPGAIGSTRRLQGAVDDVRVYNRALSGSEIQFVFNDRSPPVVRHSLFDFDGDGRADVSIFRPSVGEWYYQRSSDGVVYGSQFGTSTDKVVPGDFTGDGKADIAFWRPSTGEWFVLRSENSTYYAFPFGSTGDIPRPADYDGDGKADSAVYRPSVSTWFILRSSDGGVTSAQFGISSDVPVPADYDGDGKADVAIYRQSLGQWWYLRSSNGSVFAATFGSSTDKPVPGDYTGDGKVDIAFYRPSEGSWYIVRSEDQSFYAFPFGNSADKPAPADFDGDGKYAAAVFRPSDTNWYILKSTGGVQIQQFGLANDIPLPGANLP